MCSSSFMCSCCWPAAVITSDATYSQQSAHWEGISGVLRRLEYVPMTYTWLVCWLKVTLNTEKYVCATECTERMRFPSLFALHACIFNQNTSARKSRKYPSTNMIRIGVEKQYQLQWMDIWEQRQVCHGSSNTGATWRSEKHEWSWQRHPGAAGGPL